jgi:hypothetical protein
MFGNKFNNIDPSVKKILATANASQELHTTNQYKTDRQMCSVGQIFHRIALIRQERKYIEFRTGDSITEEFETKLKLYSSNNVKKEKGKERSSFIRQKACHSFWQHQKPNSQI